MNQNSRSFAHRCIIGQPVFVTFRLYGSLPANRIFDPDQISISGKAFVAMDRILDAASSGPRYLEGKEIAEIVVNVLQDGESRFHRYQLHAFAVMPNHVHLLVSPNVELRKWLGPLKGFTSYRANQVLMNTVHPLWQDGSYDHSVQSDAEFARIRAYIHRNPVTAGLAPNEEEFPWSSAQSTGAEYADGGAMAISASSNA